MELIYTLVVGIVSYLIGSINSSILISKAVMGKDIRESGSGNAGATNMLRTMGKKYAIITLVIDILKGVVALLLAKLAIRLGAYAVSTYIAGVAVVIGHNFPVFFGFKGGKGVATAGYIALMLDWRLFVILVCVFLAAALITKYVSFASLCCAVAYPISQYILGQPFLWHIVLGLFLAVLVTFMHRENIKRLINHTESKFAAKKLK